MSDPTIDPAELAARIKRDSEERLIVAAVTAGLRTGEHDDRLSTWALVVAGSIPALAWVNAELIQELAHKPLGVVAIALLAASGIAGILQRYWGHLVRINLVATGERQDFLSTLEKEQNERIGLILKPRAARKLEETGELTDQDLLSDVAIVQSSKPDLGYVDREVSRNLQESQPGIIRAISSRRGAQKALEKWGSSWLLRYLTRLRAWQSILLAIQILTLVASFAIGGLALLLD